jgi:hypothetical protein
MKQGYTGNDGAVPLFSQQAVDVPFAVPVKVVDMGNTDHEEFYGSEPDQRSEATVEKGFTTSRKTFEEAAMKHPSRSCPVIEATTRNDGDFLVIEGRLVFPLYETENGGDGMTGKRIDKIEVMRKNFNNVVINGFENTIEDNGSFMCRIKKKICLREGDIWY